MTTTPPPSSDASPGETVRHLRTLADLGRDGLLAVLDRAAELKALRGTPEHPRPLSGKTVVILLEKASTRTRLSFEAGVVDLGGHPSTVLAKDTQLGRGEPIEDTARMLSRYVHAVVYRTHAHARVEALAAASRVPVINGLTDDFHPCQLLADLLTVREAFGADLSRQRVAWIGDGNNMAHSWAMAAGLLGFELVCACPDGYRPDPAILDRARQLGPGSIRVVGDPGQAVDGATVVTTDVWASMGQEAEAAARRAAFDGFIVDAARMGRAAAEAIFLHCLPAHRGEEVAAEVIDGPQSRVWDEAENRLHTQKALLELLVY
ncbi:MAG TPA: ornithine carbamoyltransferase [Polyangiaceae bacterium LLY-WYZ-14_1]|nr:ornithine carbamoyltransferase [Polyangiaceae bacterium LLY-WYZ-14_1]